MKGYKPLRWDADSLLSKGEREAVDRQRLDLWKHGVRREPLLTRMAFEFAALETMLRARKPDL